MNARMPYSYQKKGRFNRSTIPYRARTAERLIAEIIWWRDYYLRHYKNMPRQQKPLELPFQDERFMHRRLSVVDVSEALKPHSDYLRFERGEEFRRVLTDGEVVLQAFWFLAGQARWQFYLLQGELILSVTPEMRGSSNLRIARSCS